MKTLKFVDSLIPLVLEGRKNTTWRINDEKNFFVGETISLLSNLGEEFGRAEILSLKETTFRDLDDDDDKEGHEGFLSDAEMYETYSRYYGFEVLPETKLKVIKFRLLNGK